MVKSDRCPGECVLRNKISSPIIALRFCAPPHTHSTRERPMKSQNQQTPIRRRRHRYLPARGYDIRPWYEYSPAPPLSVTHPELVEEWHRSRNGIYTPDDFTYGSQVAIWWQCPRDPRHAWRARIEDRTVSGSTCPYCARKRASTTNNLRVHFPDIAAEWHLSKNGKLVPDAVLPMSNRKVWWQCQRDDAHEWLTAVSRRTANGTGCPYCAGSRPSKTHSLAVAFPNLAQQFHPIKNGNLTANDVTPGSNMVVAWKCPQGDDHEWEGSIKSRTRTGKGYPFCHGLRASVTNSLVSLYPEIAAEVHPTRNPELKPDTLIAHSPRKIWWLCAPNPEHEWPARVQDRTQRLTGCPHCAGRKNAARTSQSPFRH